MQNDLRNVASEEILGLTEKQLSVAGATHTAREIVQQPTVWRKIYHTIAADCERISAFLQQAVAKSNLEIILTGAGSSSFIGRILEGSFTMLTGRCTRALATTDILTHPERYLRRKTPLLLVSFARSGNSPESAAVVSLVNRMCTDVHHLVITCNASGQLATGVGDNGKELVLLLPPETDDKSLVMTSSFTGMLLAGLLVTRINNLEAYSKQVDSLAAYGEKIIFEFAESVKSVSAMDFDRVVFLGSGPLVGAAEESQLKVQELTAGKVIGKHDSYLGFRHGPKAMIGAQTLLVYLFSNKEYAFRYESDLLKDVNAKEKGLFSVGLIESGGDALEVDLLLQLTTGTATVDEDFLAVVSVMPAQLLGFFSCLKFGLKPDNPSTNGSITRIVEGVNIYPFETTKHSNV